MFVKRCLVITACTLLAAPALASIWCGQNGVVRLSFTQAETLQSVTTVAPGENGVTLVDVWAYLDEVEPMERDGEVFLAIGGFELKLVIEGAPGSIVKQEFPFPRLNIGPELGFCVVGIDPSARLVKGRTELVHWQVMFPQPPQKVVLRLDPDSVPSCKTVEGCPGSGSFAIYTGTVDADQVSDLFGTGCVPAYLNWPQAPEVKALRGTSSWRDVGVYTPESDQPSPNKSR
jgi:hypothetical protein